MILGCQSDDIQTPMGTLHKDNIGVLVVATDIFSILVITYFFRKLKELNAEYIDVIDSL